MFHVLKLYFTFKASFSCPAGWRLYQGECYKQIDEQLDWAGARNKCKAGHASADLADIRNVEEEDFIISKIIS